MDLERLKKIHTARSDFVTAANEDLPEAQKGQVDELKERFKTLAERMSRYVEHEHYGPAENGYYSHTSAARELGRFEGPMPKVSVRFRYFYRLEDGTMFSHMRGVEPNEHGERIETVVVEFLEAPYGVTSEPISSGEDVPVTTNYGEVFATESLSFSENICSLENEDLDQSGAERLWGFHPSVKLTLLEQAMDQYEAAPPSPYELRLGLAT